MDLSRDTMLLKDPLVLFGFEGSALSFPPFIFSHRIDIICFVSVLQQ